jgi:hypothetical protein
MNRRRVPVIKNNSLSGVRLIQRNVLCEFLVYKRPPPPHTHTTVGITLQGPRAHAASLVWLRVQMVALAEFEIMFRVILCPLNGKTKPYVQVVSVRL